MVARTEFVVLYIESTPRFWCPSYERNISDGTLHVGMNAGVNGLVANSERVLDHQNFPFEMVDVVFRRAVAFCTCEMSQRWTLADSSKLLERRQYGTVAATARNSVMNPLKMACGVCKPRKQPTMTCPLWGKCYKPRYLAQYLKNREQTRTKWQGIDKLTGESAARWTKCKPYSLTEYWPLFKEVKQEFLPMKNKETPKPWGIPPEAYV